MWRVGLGVWLKAVLSTSSCLALIVVRGPRLLPSSQFIRFFCLKKNYIVRADRDLPLSLPPLQGSQRDVVHLGWPIAPSYISPNAGGGWRIAGPQPMSTAVHAHGAQRNFGDLTPYLTMLPIQGPGSTVICGQTCLVPTFPNRHKKWHGPVTCRLTCHLSWYKNYLYGTCHLWIAPTLCPPISWPRLTCTCHLETDTPPAPPPPSAGLRWPVPVIRRLLPY